MIKKFVNFFLDTSRNRYAYIAALYLMHVFQSQIQIRKANGLKKSEK